MTRSEILQIAKPILFNVEMIRAILDGRKTETRRVVKPQPRGTMHPKTLRMDEKFPRGWRDESLCDLFLPPHEPGCYLYVRETWCKWAGYHYRVDDGADGEYHQVCHGQKWKPSIHMPKEAARIFLRVTDVRAERLQEITMSGMQAEGVIPENVTGGHWQQWQNDYMRPVWESTVKAKERCQYGWEANPYVWVISFERVMPE